MEVSTKLEGEVMHHMPTAQRQSLSQLNRGYLSICQEIKEELDMYRWPSEGLIQRKIEVRNKIVKAQSGLKANN